MHSSVLALMLAFVSPARASDPLGVVGTWNVTSSFTRSSCGKLDVSAARQWLISANGDEYNVKVVGSENFSKLAGKVKDGKLVVMGYQLFTIGPAQVAGMARYELALQNGALTGTGDVTMVGGPTALDGKNVAVACSGVAEVKATK